MCPDVDVNVKAAGGSSGGPSGTNWNTKAIEQTKNFDVPSQIWSRTDMLPAEYPFSFTRCTPHL